MFQVQFIDIALLTFACFSLCDLVDHYVNQQLSLTLNTGILILRTFTIIATILLWFFLHVVQSYVEGQHRHCEHQHGKQSKTGKHQPENQKKENGKFLRLLNILWNVVKLSSYIVLAYSAVRFQSYSEYVLGDASNYSLCANNFVFSWALMLCATIFIRQGENEIKEKPVTMKYKMIRRLYDFMLICIEISALLFCAYHCAFNFYIDKKAADRDYTWIYFSCLMLNQVRLITAESGSRIISFNRKIVDEEIIVSDLDKKFQK